MPRRCRPLLGTFVEITADAAGAIDAGFAAVERVHALMSAHDPQSDVGRINRLAQLAPVEVDDWTALVLERALAWSSRSAGAFDVVRAGKRAIERKLLPRHSGQPVPEASDWTQLKVRARSVRLLRPGCVDLGGIAKGFAVDVAAAAMRRAGAVQGLVNAGGDLLAFGPDPWRVTVAHPQTRAALVEIELRQAALATSALLADGSGAHLPSGSDWIAATVRAPTACVADALTKIVWAGGDMQILDEAGASAFGIRPSGLVEGIAAQCLAA